MDIVSNKNMEYKDFKDEILKRAKNADACMDQYKRAYRSESFEELMQVIKDNFSWCCLNKVIDSVFIMQNESCFSNHEIYCNVSVDKGFLLCDTFVESISGDAISVVFGNGTVKYVYDNGTVKYVSGNGTVESVYGNGTVKYVSGNGTVKYVYGNGTVKYVSDNGTVKSVSGNGTVESVSDNGYIVSNTIIECKISDNAIHRILDRNTIRYASDDIKFEKV